MPSAPNTRDMSAQRWASIDLRVEINTDDVLRFLGALESQIPYATSVAINNTLNDIQKAERAHVRETFTVRRPDFIDRSIYIARDDRARKDKLTGTVRINPSRDVLAKFEEDTVKRGQGGRSLAVPIIRDGQPGLVIRRGDAISVKNLMLAAAAARGGKRLSRTNRKRKEPVAVDRKRVFLIKSRKTGSHLLVERTGPGVHGRFDNSRVLWAFRKEVPIEPNLHFREIAREVALRTWQENAADAIDLAIRTAR